MNMIRSDQWASSFVNVKQQQERIPTSIYHAAHDANAIESQGPTGLQPLDSVHL